MLKIFRPRIDLKINSGFGPFEKALAAGMNFELTAAEVARVEAWKKQFDSWPQGVSGGTFTYIFIPTSIGMIVKVRHASGAELDLTDYSAW